MAPPKVKKFLHQSVEACFQELLPRKFHHEQEVKLEPGEFQEFFQDKIEKRKWKKLLSFPLKCNEELVHEFYSNALPRQEIGSFRTSMVRGTKVRYDVVTINKFLKTDFQDLEAQSCTYFELKDKDDFDPDKLAKVLCIPGKSYVKAKESNKAYKFKKDALRTITQISMSFAFSNVAPTLHTSNLNRQRASLIYCILANIPINIGKVISDKIHSLASSKNFGEEDSADKPLVFPALIIALCAYQKAKMFVRFLKSLKKPITKEED